MEVPAEADTLLNLHIIELVAGDRLKVRGRIGDRSAEQASVGLQDIHRVHDASEDALAAAQVIYLREALERDGEAEVADLADFLGEIIVDQGTVGVGMESTVMMLLAQLQDVIFTNQRFAACEHVEIDAELLALGDDPVQILIAQVQPVAVLCSPASDTVKIAGTRGIHQDQPRDIAVIFHTVRADRLGPVEHRLKAKIQKRHLQHIRIELIDKTVQILIPLFIRIRHHGADPGVGLLRKHIADILLDNINQLEHAFLPVLVDPPQHDIDRLRKSDPRHLMRKISHPNTSCFRSFSNYMM